jgi:hypothetical protein
VTVKRPINTRIVAGALLLGGAAAAVLSTALAQELGLPVLRGFGETRPTPPLTTLAPRDPLADPAQAKPGTNATPTPPTASRLNLRRMRRAQARRTRPPVAAPQVRPDLRPPAASTKVAPEVQPPQAGLPDPAVPPPVVKRKKPKEEDPYAQLGLRAGGITFLPAIEENLGYDSNPNRLSGAHKGSLLSKTEGSLAVQSDWPVHALTGFLRGAYSAYPNVSDANRPEGEGRLALRIDATRDLQFDIEGHGKLETQRPGSPELNASVTERPLVESYGASVGVTQKFNRLSIGLRGTVDRFVYEDAHLTSGTILDQSDRNENQYGVRLRAGYELTPGVIPFVEALADTRVYDQKIDNSGFRRSSDGVGFRAGSTFELTRQLTGEASAGLQARRYDDPRLRDLRGPLVDASLIWAATPLTTVRLRASSTIDETTLPNSSGAISERASLEVQHDLRRNLSVIAGLGVGRTDYKGVYLKEDTLTASLKAEYKLTRSVVLRASFTHERLKSSSPGSDYSANTYLVGLRVQP